MPGDYSREIFDHKKHYSSVRMQQGRVQLDADWNAQSDIQSYRIETEAIDVIGQSGVPKGSDGFKIGTTSGGDDLTISPGRIYVDGLLFVLDQPSTYTTQPHFPNPDFTTPTSPPSGSPPGNSLQLSLDAGFYLAFLDGWQREITALDDELIREVALGGPDTTTRLQNVWQVRLFQVGGPGSPPASPPSPTPTCRNSFDEYDEYTAPSTGTLNARTQPSQEEDSVCLLPPSSGYNRLENQHYRIEIHTGGSRDQATFKWSRNNASFEAKINNIDDDVVTVSEVSKDEVLRFVGNQWVEIADDESTLKGTPHPLVQIDKIDPSTSEITMKVSVAAFANLSGLKLRGWDQTVDADADGVSANLASAIELEGGIQVEFSPGQYRSGDYWLIPARTVTGEIEWPRDESPDHNPIPQLPRGIRHHFCHLALIEVAGGVATVIDDCRKQFPPLTEIIHFFYVGGAGQEAMPGERLPCPLQVGVTNDQFPVIGASVKFVIVTGSEGTLHSGSNAGPTLTVLTNAEGVAQCEWELGEVGGDQGRRCLQVEASLVGAEGDLFEPPIRFNANLSIASLVAYEPHKCPELAEAEAFTVQAAIDRLCQLLPREEPGIRINEILTDTDRRTLLNDMLVPVGRLEKGIIVVCGGPISPVCAGGSPIPPPPRFPDAVPDKPTCYVTLDLPYPIGGDINLWDPFDSIVGFQPLILAAKVLILEHQLIWLPTAAVRQWLKGFLFQKLRERDITDRVLAHLTLKGNFIFSPDTQQVYLDGDAFGFGHVGTPDRLSLSFPTGDGRKGGDFEMWFWLVESYFSEQVTGVILSVSAEFGAAGGIVRGSVKDNAEAVIADVEVTLTEVETGKVRTGVTNEQGEFVFPNIAPGDYEVSTQVGDVTVTKPIPVGR